MGCRLVGRFNRRNLGWEVVVYLLDGLVATFVCCSLRRDSIDAHGLGGERSSLLFDVLNFNEYELENLFKWFLFQLDKTQDPNSKYQMSPTVRAFRREVTAHSLFYEGIGLWRKLQDYIKFDKMLGTSKAKLAIAFVDETLNLEVLFIWGRISFLINQYLIIFQRFQVSATCKWYAL